MHEIARWLIWGEAFDAILNSYYNCCYYIIRFGGKTVTTFLFDSGFIWGVSVVAAMIIAYRTSIAIVPFYWIERTLDIFKCVIFFVLVKRAPGSRSCPEPIRLKRRRNERDKRKGWDASGIPSF